LYFFVTGEKKRDLLYKNESIYVSIVYVGNILDK